MEGQVAGTIKALDRALAVLDVLMSSRQPMGVNEIAKVCQVNLSTTFRILKTLEAGGWVYQCMDDRYIIGGKVSFMTEKDSFYLALKEVSYYIMNRLSEMEGQALNLVVRQNDKCLIIQQSRTNRLIDLVPPIGTFLPIHGSAAGKVLICELPPKLLSEVLEGLRFELLTPYTIVRRNEFIAELEKVRQQQYAFDYNESMESSCCVGVPVRNSSGDVIAALSFSGILGVTSPRQLQQYLPKLQNAALEITQKLYGTFGEYEQQAVP